MLARTTLIVETSTHNTSTAKTEINRSGINELYPPVGQADRGGGSSGVLGGLLLGFELLGGGRSASVDMVMTKATRT